MEIRAFEKRLNKAGFTKKQTDKITKVNDGIFM